jgi:5'-methylthioadenosine phosphorylase
MTVGRDSLPQVEIGILGGSGMYEIEGFKDVREVTLDTPYGQPSETYMVGMLAGKEVAFLSRHGRGHRLLPSDINFRANIFGFKMLGVRRIISVTAVGSLKEEIHPTDIVLADQFFDRTRRPNTFFGGGVAAHVGMAHPVCESTADFLYQAAREVGAGIHRGGTYICIEGPAFSTKAESQVYRSWGGSVIGMTGATEAKLCREAEICYATMNLVTDYDVWHETEEMVSVDLILENLRANVHNAKAIIKKTLALLPEKPDPCDCQNSLAGCLVTQPDLIPDDKKRKLRLLLEKYIGY